MHKISQMPETLVVDIIGWLGAAAVLYAYVLVSTNRITGDSLHYQFFNVLGALFLIVNTWFNHAYPSMVVNIIWIVVAFYSLGRRYFTSVVLTGVKVKVRARPRKQRNLRRRL